MVFFNWATMQMAAKIVYYGPGLCGKTTNLSYIYAKTSPSSRGEMVSLETESDRTLFFDLLPIEVGTIGGFKTRLQLYTVPGQVFYNTTRKLVLKGVDGVVFVADSQRPMREANMESIRNLRANLAELGLDIDDIPLVLQYNKRDLKNVLTLEELVVDLNPDGAYPAHEASAINGNGVFETLKEITKLTLKKLRRRMAAPQATTGPRLPSPPPSMAPPSRPSGAVSAAALARAAEEGVEVAEMDRRPPSPLAAQGAVEPRGHEAPSAIPFPSREAPRQAVTEPEAEEEYVPPDAVTASSLPEEAVGFQGAAFEEHAVTAEEVEVDEIEAPELEAHELTAPGDEPEVLTDADMVVGPEAEPATAAIPVPSFAAEGGEPELATVEEVEFPERAVPAAVEAAALAEAPPPAAMETIEADVDIDFEQSEEAAEAELAPPPMKHVRVSNQMDILAELESLRKQATMSSEGARRSAAAPAMDLDSLLAGDLDRRKELRRKVSEAINSNVFSRMRQVEVAIRIQDSDGATLHVLDPVALDLDDASALEKLCLLLTVDLESSQ